MRKLILTKTQIIVGMCLLFVGIFFLQKSEAYASSLADVSIKEVNFEDEEIIVNNNGNTKIYFATDTDAAKENWDVMNIDNVNTDTTSIDFSWLSPTVNGVIMIKGDLKEGKSRVVIPERTRKLEISINYTNMGSITDKTQPIDTLMNIMSTAGNGKEPIKFSDLEWKKGAGGKWKLIEDLTVAQLEKFQIKGTDIYFRIKAVNHVDGSKGRRASNEVKVKIAKKTNSAVVGIDGSKFTTDIKYSREYRVKIENGVFSNWIKVTDKGIKNLKLSEIAKGYDGLTLSTAFPAMDLEIRNYATAKTAPSKSTEFHINAQRKITGTVLEQEVPEVITDADKNNIYITYTGDKYLNITIPLASMELPYEYCIVKKGSDFDPARVTWYSITKNTMYRVLSSKAVEEGMLYIRQKEIKYRAETKTTDEIAFALASTPVSYKISYPSIPTIEKQTLTFTKGNYGEDLTFKIKLNVAGKDPYENKIKSIKIGTKEIVFDDKKIEVVDGISTMTVTLFKTSLENMANCTNRAITITYDRGTIDKTSVKLTIKNPTPAGKLTLSPEPGTLGTTTINVISSPAPGNKFVYKLLKEESKYTDDVLADFLDLVPNIAVAKDSYITVYEINIETKKVVKLQYVQILDTHIGK